MILECTQHILVYSQCDTHISTYVTKYPFSQFDFIHIHTIVENSFCQSVVVVALVRRNAPR